MTGPVGAPDLPPLRTAGRLERLRTAMTAAGIDALLVTNLTNVRYLTGFTGSAGMVLVRPADCLMVTDGRYGAQAADQLAVAGVDARLEVAGEGRGELLAAAARGAGRVGLEADHLSWADARHHRTEWFGGLDVVPTSGLVEGLRIVKDAGEVARVRAAAAIADAALATVVARLADGPTEAEFGLELDLAMRRGGATRPSFETIVASGPNSARPHHRPGDRRIVEGDLVVVDFGAVVDGYCSDMTRTVVVGEPDPTQARLWRVVAEAQAAGVAQVAAGVEAARIDRACRSIIDGAGWADAFTHGTGHGVGLDIHEAPRVAATSDATLAAGHIVTVEPGVYLEGHGGVRIEDTVVVTDHGCEPLTLTPKSTTLDGT